MENPRNNRMDIVSVSDLVPVDIIFKKRQVSEFGKVGFVPESVMKKHFTKRRRSSSLK